MQNAVVYCSAAAAWITVHCTGLYHRPMLHFSCELVARKTVHMIDCLDSKNVNFSLLRTVNSTYYMSSSTLGLLSQSLHKIKTSYCK